MLKEISFEDIKNIWKNNNTPIGIYIHSPWCKTNCTYCVYNGRISDFDKEGDKYFKEFLPKEIDKYLPIINENVVQSIYFGGGTPNYRGDLDQLIPSFEKLKDIKCAEKTIELHTGWKITDDQLKLLQSYGFTTIILCVQTFDKNLLAEVNRYHEYDNNVEELIQKIHQLDMNVGMDFLYFPKKSSCTENDLNILSSFKENPDEITFSTIYKDKNINSVRDFLSIMRRSQLIEKGMIPYVGDIYTTNEQSIKDLETLVSRTKCFRLFTKAGLRMLNNKKLYSFIDYLEEIQSPPLIGIGGYRNPAEWVYSGVGGYRYHTEIMNLDNPKYILDSELSFWDKIRNLVDWAESVLGNDSTQGLSFSCQDICSISTNTGTKLRNKEYLIPFDFRPVDGRDLYDQISKLNRSLNIKGENNIVIKSRNKN